MARDPRPLAILRFGTSEVDLRAGELRKQGVRIKLQEQPFHVLTLLIQKPGEVVTREELRDHNWSPDTFVDFDNSLNTAINKLREALGDSAENPRFIETLPRRGYRFLLPVSGDHQKETSNLTVKWKLAACVLAIALLIAVVGSLYRRSRNTQRLTEKDTIVLADFTNTTGDPVFDDTLKQGLRVQLEQSPFLNILSDQQVDEQLKLMARSAGERLTPELARDLCQRMGSKAALNSTISTLGSHYVLGLSALNCHNGDALATEQVEADSREHVLKALGDAATKMRQKLGESLASIEKYDAPMEQATTASLEALQAYSIGLRTDDAKGQAAALPFYQRAVQLDPKFAMAYARLGHHYAVTGAGAPHLSAENVRKAYELRERVTERERLYIEAHYYRDVTGEEDKAASVWEVMQQTYPRAVESYSNLAGFYGRLGNYEKALEEAHEALRLAPDDQNSYTTVGYLFMCLNRLDEAQAAFKQAEERHLESELLLSERYSLAFLKGDADGMARVAESAAPTKPLLLVLQGLTEAYYGRLRKARELLRRAVESAKQNGAVGRAATFQAFGSLTEAYLGDLQHARADADAALPLAANRIAQTEAALALALAGDTEHAEKLTAVLNENFPLNTVVQGMWVPTTRAAIALSHKNPAKAIELLRVVSSYELGTTRLLPIYERGRAYLMLHDGSAAAAEFQKVIDHPGIVREFPVGALAHLGLGRAYVLQGDTAKAKAAYQDFLTLWKDADQDIPILKQAKTEYAKLQ